MTLLPLTSVDLQASAPVVRMPLDRAGVHGVVRGLLLPGAIACTAHISLDAAVSAELRGVHMSRFHEGVDAAIEACGMSPAQPEPGRLEQAKGVAAGLDLLAARLAAEAASRQESPTARARVEALITLPARAPASGRPTHEPVRLVAGATHAAEQLRRALAVEVTGITACPCAQLLVRDAAHERLAAHGMTPEEIERVLALVPVATHNQRGTATLEIELAPGSSSVLEPAVLAELAWDAMSARTFELLKREDERTVVEQAHANPRFVEDCVRELVRSVLSAQGLGLGDADRILARQVNHESIHAHDVHAELAGTVAELRAGMLG